MVAMTMAIRRTRVGMYNRGHLGCERLGLILSPPTAGPAGQTSAATGGRGRFASEGGTGPHLGGRTDDVRDGQRPIRFLEQLEPVLRLSGVNSRRPQIGDASSEICPLPARLGFSFRRLVFGPRRIRQSRNRLLWLLLLEVGGLHTRWMWTRDGAEVKRRSDRAAIHVGANVERSLVA